MFKLSSLGTGTLERLNDRPSIRECVENHRLRVPFVNSHDNLADFFTKPLNAKNFFRLRDIIMNITHAT